MGALVRFQVFAVAMFVVTAAGLFCAGLSEIVPIALCARALTLVGWLTAWVPG